MIGLAVSKAWDQYYSSSPYLNLLRAKPHPRFKFLHALPHETQTEAYKAEVNSCEAIVFDDVLHKCFDYYQGPKFMVGGDEHSHSPAAVEKLETQYSHCDYILTGSPFSPKMSPPYFYISDETRSKFLYFPHTVADEAPEAAPWRDRDPRVLLSGSISELVYPYRHLCQQIANQDNVIRILPMGRAQHGDYFHTLGLFRHAITCDSFLKYTVAKYFEIPWMGTLLVASPLTTPDKDLLGFSSFENCIFYDNAHLIPEMARQAMEPHYIASYEKMAAAGHAVVMKYHTVSKRLNYLARLCDAAQKGRLSVFDSVNLFLEERNAK